MWQVFSSESDVHSHSRQSQNSSKPLIGTVTKTQSDEYHIQSKMLENFKIAKCIYTIWYLAGKD